MPEPSLLPILNAVGVSLAIVGITLSIVVTVVGAVLFLVTLVRWIRAAAHEISELRGLAPLTDALRPTHRFFERAPTRIGFAPWGSSSQTCRRRRCGGARRALRRGVRRAPRRGRRERARRRLRARPRGRRGAVQRARLRRRPSPGADRRARLPRRPAARARSSSAAAEFLRESLSTFEIAARGYHEVQEIARIEHEHIEQLRSLADASVAINSSLTVEEILQLTADAARAVLGARARLDRDPGRRAAPPAARGDLAAGARGLRRRHLRA